jgi:glucose-1-phosphatase
MNQVPPRCLLLDLGMVMIGVNYHDFAVRMKAHTGLGPDQLREVFAAESLGKRFETGLISAREFFEEVCRRTGACLQYPEFVSAWNSMIGQPIIPGHWIAALARQVRLWVISNTNELHYDWLKAGFDALHHFEGFILSHEVGVAKPDERIFRIALERMRVPAAEVVFVDDLAANVNAAKSLGIDGFVFVDPDRFAAELRARGLAVAGDS